MVSFQGVFIEEMTVHTVDVYLLSHRCSLIGSFDGFFNGLPGRLWCLVGFQRRRIEVGFS
jgi:hypothetical protein